ncbi:hypothetical protein [Georgenia sp. SYP-B2076]|uniref:hypothetical protein n=1 Tax=Georgenia sp. SYP-B2076 TaxID=2495881 RepID=UPI000F8D85FB|nr:hypothetical protein [Georgenia sp. SYP-B2076]
MRPRSEPRAGEELPAATNDTGAGARRETDGAWRERGAASAEFAGMIFVVVLVVGALLTAAAPGGGLSGAFENALCRAFSSFGLECGGSSGDAAADSRVPDEICVVATEGTKKSLGVTVMSVDLDGGGAVAVETLADGTYRVTFQGDLQGGVSGGVGAGATVTWDDEQYGGEASAGGGAAAVLTGGGMWEVDSKEEKDALVAYFQEELSNATTPIVGPAKNLWNAMPWVDRYQPPPPTSVFGEVGVKGSGSAVATALDRSASAKGDVGVALGIETNLETGEVTTYYQVDYDVSAEANVGRVVEVDGSAESQGTGIIAVTLDPKGEYLTNVELQGTVFGAADGSVDPIFGQGFSGDASGGQVLSASVDLTRGESLSIATDLLRGAGIPVPPGSHGGGDSPEGPLSFVGAAQTFVGAAQERGELWRQEFDGDSSTPFAFNASGKLGVALGARYDNSTSQTNVTDAEYWDGQVWAPWVSCHS